MAKKAVAGYRERASKEGRGFAKVIKMVRSEKTGAYVFKEEMVPNDLVQDHLKKKKQLKKLNKCFLLLILQLC